MKKHYNNNKSFNNNRRKVKNFNFEVIVRNGNVEQALKIFKRKTKKSGIKQELKDRMFYTKPSDKRRLAKKRAVRRQFLVTKANKEQMYW